jgi:Tol biopolymer transport system component
MIAFSGLQDLHKDVWSIYVMDDDGTNLRSLTSRKLDDCTAPAWSPDGRTIAFTSSPRTLPRPMFSYLVDIGRGHTRRLSSDADLHFLVWLPDGRIAAYSYREGRPYELYVMNDDGSERKCLLSTDDYLIDVVWSPDGQRIALTKRRDWGQLYITNGDGSNLRPILEATAPQYKPVWSPDSTHIAFVTEDDEHTYVSVTSADGSAIRRLDEIEMERSACSWSPDSRRLAYVGYHDWRYALCVIDVDGGNRRLLADLNIGDESGEVYPSNPIWSADGQWIIFSTYEWEEDANTGVFHIYRMAADRSTKQRLTRDRQRFALIYDLGLGPIASA